MSKSNFGVKLPQAELLPFHFWERLKATKVSSFSIGQENMNGEMILQRFLIFEAS